MAANAHQLDALFDVIAARRAESGDTSYTARLLAGGPALCARKFGEEAIETVIAALQGGDSKALVAESADLLYHWLVLLAASGIEPSAVYDELKRRESQSGLAEKASRQNGTPA